MGWENNSVSQTSNRRSASRKYKELTKLNSSRRRNNQISKSANDQMMRYKLPKKIMKLCSLYLAIREIQIKTTLRFHEYVPEGTKVTM